MARLTRLYTRQGDGGWTRLADGQRLPKTALRIQALGDLDELNAALGLVLAFAPHHPSGALLRRIQHRLFDLGAELALPGHHVLGTQQVLDLERAIDELNAPLPPLEEFLLPGGPPAAAQAQLARAVARRAERSLWRLAQEEPVEPHALAYLNRLSDLLFVLARTLARETEPDEPTWSPTP